MEITPIEPLAAVRPDPEIDALPKADLHLHQEWSPRLDRVLAVVSAKFCRFLHADQTGESVIAPKIAA